MANTPAIQRRPPTDFLPKFVLEPSLEAPSAEDQYDPLGAADSKQYEASYMPDDVTRDTAKRMHYAAFRTHKARGNSAKDHWRRIYFDLRDRVVLGNRKLVYRAVRQRMSLANKADDVIGDCQIVLIQAVAAYNPWLGIRFSTYAFTCILRALARMAQRASNDWLARSTPLDSLPDGELGEPYETDHVSSSNFRIDEFLREDHPLLSHREKIILRMRYCSTETVTHPTLENVGRELGLSKERVRQVQLTALDKLRKVLLEEATVG